MKTYIWVLQRGKKIYDLNYAAKLDSLLQQTVYSIINQGGG